MLKGQKKITSVLLAASLLLYGTLTTMFVWELAHARMQN
jgi:hypothetical protein